MVPKAAEALLPRTIIFFSEVSLNHKEMQLLQYPHLANVLWGLGAYLLQSPPALFAVSPCGAQRHLEQVGWEVQLSSAFPHTEQ